MKPTWPEMCEEAQILVDLPAGEAIKRVHAKGHSLADAGEARKRFFRNMRHRKSMPVQLPNGATRLLNQLLKELRDAR